MKKLLYRICLALLIASPVWAHYGGTVSVDTLAKTSASWNGEALPGYADGKPEVTILKITIPPNVRLPLHKHTVINAGVLLKGELTVVTDEGKILHMKAGDSIVEVVERWHYGKNEGTEPAEIIVFYAGIAGEPITIKETIQKKWD